ncbi:MAG: DUF5658 family protein [Pseudomonadota bacterium]
MIVAFYPEDPVRVDRRFGKARAQRAAPNLRGNIRSKERRATDSGLAADRRHNEGHAGALFTLISPGGLGRLKRDAASARRRGAALQIAWILVAAYNVVGVLDIVSTNLALSTGQTEEANPVMRAAMTQLGEGWIVAKLALQGLISAMVVWFPHPFVTGVFLLAVTTNALIVVNNLLIYWSL